ncbi:MAG: hypothetical protein L6R19_25595 [Alphaproteobacteria bacterium]|nr:hypothetical protein [Alphaproteobacteria bacterium]
MTTIRTAIRAAVLALPLVGLAGAMMAPPAFADRDDRRGWRQRDNDHRWRHRDWHYGEWRHRHPDVYVAPGYYYAPPPVVYAPPPVYPGFGIGLNFNFD